MASLHGCISRTALFKLQSMFQVIVYTAIVILTLLTRVYTRNSMDHLHAIWLVWITQGNRPDYPGVHMYTCTVQIFFPTVQVFFPCTAYFYA